MTKRRNKKQALMASILSLILCVSMLLGTTMAWFTDTVTNTGNRIEAGTLKVKLLRHDGSEYQDISNGTGDIFIPDANDEDAYPEGRFNGILWEPNKTEIVYLAVENAGNLALNYNIILTVTNANADSTNTAALEEVLKFAVVPGLKAEDAAGKVNSWEDVQGLENLETGSVSVGEIEAAPNGALEAKETDFFALAVHMDKEAGNEYQGTALNIDVKIVAKQMTLEEDSFGNQYDADAKYEGEVDGIIINAEGETKFFYQNYVQKSRPDIVDYKNPDCAHFKNGDWFEYEVYIPADGTYAINTYASIKGSNVTFGVSVDGTEVIPEGGPVVGGDKWFNFTNPHLLGLLSLTEGSHIIRIKNKTTDLHLESFSLEPVDDNVIIVSGEEEEETKFFYQRYVQKSRDNITDYKDPDCAHFLNGDWFEYKVYIPADGNYEINTYASTKTDNVNFKVFVDEAEVAEGTVVAGGKWFNFTNPHLLGTLTLTKGIHTIRIKNVTADLHLESFSFKVAEEVEEPDTFDYESLGEESDVVQANLYVAPDGDASNEGTSESEALTIEAALTKLAGMTGNMTGDIVVNFAPGYYELSKTIELSNAHGGTNGYNVIFKGIGDGEAVISGGTEVTGWSKPSNSPLWEAPLTTVTEVRNLYVNDYPAIRARSKYTYTLKETYVVDGSEYASDGFLVDDRNFLKFDNPEDLETVWEGSWRHFRIPVEDIIYDSEDYEGSAVFVMKNPAWAKSLSTQEGIVVKDQFYLENAKELLDEPGEFYYDSREQKIYYYPYPEEEMETAKTYVGKTKTIVNINGTSKDDKVSNIIFDNLSFKYGVWDEISEEGMLNYQSDAQININGSSGHVPGGLKMQSPGQFVVNNTANLTIKNCLFACLGSSALQFEDAVDGVKVEGNIIRDVSGAGIMIGTWLHCKDNGNLEAINGEICNHFMVRNNVIRRVANEYFSQTAISIYYEANIYIEHNDIQDTPYTGITAGWGWETLSLRSDEHKNINITHNKISDVLKLLNDGAQIYTLGDMRGSTIAYNYLTDSHNQNWGGIYLDAGSSNITIHDNVSLRNPQWLFISWGYGAKNDDVYNNYSDIAKWGKTGSPDSAKFEEAAIIEENNISAEAQTIIDQAGLEDAYIGLLEAAKLPDYREDKIDTIPNAVFLQEEFLPTYGWIQAEHFQPGVNNATYYDTYDFWNNNLYRPEGVDLLLNTFTYGTADEYIIQNTFPGEWLTYKVYIPEDGNYTFKLKYSHGYKAGSSFKIYLDDVALTEENYAIARGENGWKEILVADCGEYQLTKGEHTLKFEFTGDGFYLDALGFFGASTEVYPVIDYSKPSTNYDEGKIN